MGFIPSKIQAAIANAEPRAERTPKGLRPDGTYRARVIDTIVGVSAAGNTKVGLELKFADTHPAHYDTIKDVNALVMTEKAAWKVEVILTALGLPLTAELDELINREVDLVIGREVSQTRTNDDGSPKEFNVVKYYNAVKTVDADPAPAPVFVNLF